MLSAQLPLPALLPVCRSASAVLPPLFQPAFKKIWHVSGLLFSPTEGTIDVTKQKVRCIFMSEEFGPDFITITDEDGSEFELEHLDTLEYNGQVYMAFFPTLEGEEGDAEVEDVDLD